MNLTVNGRARPPRPRVQSARSDWHRWRFAL